MNGLPVARFRVVITTCSRSFAMGPDVSTPCRSLPVGHNVWRKASFTGRGSIQNQLQCLRFSGSSHSSTTVVPP